MCPTAIVINIASKLQLLKIFNFDLSLCIICYLFRGPKLLKQGKPSFQREGTNTQKRTFAFIQEKPENSSHKLHIREDLTHKVKMTFTNKLRKYTIEKLPPLAAQAPSGPALFVLYLKFCVKIYLLFSEIYLSWNIFQNYLWYSVHNFSEILPKNSKLANKTTGRK